MMRIWITFTATSIIIIFCISFLYMFSFRTFDEEAHMKDMKVAHEMLLKSNDFSHPVEFNNLRNLKKVENFIVENRNNNRKIVYLNRLPNFPNSRRYVEKRNLNESSQTLHINKTSNNFSDHDQNMNMYWMSNLTKHVRGESQFKVYHNKVKFLIVISPIADRNISKLFLVTYMPYFKDNSMFYEAIAIGVIFIIMALFTSKIVANFISKPLKNLEGYTKKIANKNWDKPIKITSYDEIGRLADSMNIMQRKLKYADENEKIFLQSISHDLKTPVMIIMSYAEAIIDGVYMGSIEKTANIIKKEAINLDNRIKKILYLNTLEYALENYNDVQNINLKDIVLNMVDRFRLINNKINWDVDIKKIVIAADEEKINVCIENILDNALRYARSIIRVSLKTENNKSILEIYNDGNNINNDAVKYIFNSLYKDKTGNFGLGLAISKKIIDFYKGNIKMINREEGVSFIISFPL
ncbi:sensor histidine kinase [Clostridium tyrobutyricum]|uniref:sensor histidine kinase n=1 Tax=Clostridium tyrobutyricum TaxID=1519 RepID=UPI00073D95A6|nr:HAMP domain-containing sensor histidine kinase [Clostridium tyrobutyricum]MBV4419273.1 HAMP domain-containing histidine kinase [Clostridium tyrobutyricum]